MTGPGGPLVRVRSIKLKLGAIVAGSVVVAAVLATVGAGAGVPPWLSLPVTVALALAVTQLLAVGMTSPLRQMTEVTRRLAAGDYSARVDTTATDEIGELATAINRMAGDLGSADEERRDLIANVSHELRTPLAALCAVLENLADGVVPPDPAQLHVALAQAERLGALVADLLDLSRIESGATPMRLSRVDVAALLERTVAEAGLAGRGVAYATTVSPADLSVAADPDRLGQLIANLVDNATRHSPADGTVGISATLDPGERSWTLTVTDSGPGVAPADRARVFERFGTLAGTEGGGTGLGLAIARWVATLHGGTLGFVDPPLGRGAQVQTRLPLDPLPNSTQEVTVAKSAPPPPAPPSAAAVVPPARGTVSGPWQALFGQSWPEDRVPPRPWLIGAALAVGLLSGWLLPFELPGLGLFVVLLAAGITLTMATRHCRDPFTLSCYALGFTLTLPVLFRAAEWIVLLCLLAACLLFVSGATRGNRIGHFAAAAIAWPLAALRGLPWVASTLHLLGTRRRAGNLAALIRTGLWSLLALCVFGVLFASADALFAAWLDIVLPSWDLGDWVVRGFITVAVGGVVLAGGYLALNPPPVTRLPGPAASPAARRYEWLVPVLLIDAVFGLFLIAQATAFFGGHDYLRRTTGLTYADYVHQGFGQLTVATVLTLGVMALTARKAAAADRVWLQAALGVLGVFTLVVVASALYRMHLYQQAYGFTTLRLLVDVFEGWLGVVVVAVLVTGATARTRVLARFALLSGAGALLVLAGINPDAWVASANLDRYAETGRLDWRYLQTLSADADPVLVRGLPADVLPCVFTTWSVVQPDGWTGWNLGRARARAAVADISLSESEPPECATVSEWPTR